jgi:hypothetical protein
MDDDSDCGFLFTAAISDSRTNVGFLCGLQKAFPEMLIFFSKYLPENNSIFAANIMYAETQHG